MRDKEDRKDEEKYEHDPWSGWFIDLCEEIICK